MSKLQELIDSLCPNGVEFKPLGEVCKFINGFAFKSNLFKEDGLSIIRITNINGSSVDMNDVKFFHKEDYNVNLEQFSVHTGDILVAMSGATTGKIGYYNAEQTSYLNQRVGKFVPLAKVLLNRYLFHFLLTQTDKLYIMAGGGAQPNLSSAKLLSELIIPVPPLPVQDEIVRILDRFADYAAELQARKEQYEYYRNLLLTFNPSACGCGTDDEQKDSVIAPRQPLTKSNGRKWVKYLKCKLENLLMHHSSVSKSRLICIHVMVQMD